MRKTTKVKPIETVYNGCRFRSRLEARWAVFFDALSIEWEYEPEGFDLGNGKWYLPDFFLPRFNTKNGTWVEIKPIHKKTLMNQIAKVGLSTASDFLILTGIPSVTEYELYDFDLDLIVTCCWSTKYLPGGANESEYRLFVQPGGLGEVESHAPHEAIASAKQARFEHGENQKVRRFEDAY
jgi:hypothetical protein